MHRMIVGNVNLIPKCVNGLYCISTSDIFTGFFVSVDRFNIAKCNTDRSLFLKQIYAFQQCEVCVL